ncbi:hypothetical protein [Azospirillum endophyticum]
MASAHVGTFAGISAGAPRPEILAAAQAARAASADLLIAIGGGSAIDAAKVVQLCLWGDLSTHDDLEPYARGTKKAQPGPQAIRSIAIPTTMSAAEFASLGGSYNPETGRKEPFDHPLFVPVAVVSDPAALAAAPTALTVSTGVRTIDHCVERFCSTRAQPYSDALAVGALKVLLKHLVTIYEGHAELAAYAELQVASWMSMSAVNANVSVGASHAIGRVLGATTGVPHGQTSAILLPAVLAWNEGNDTAAKRQAQLAREIGIDGDLPRYIGDYIAAAGQPRRLSTVGVRRDQFSKIAHDSMIMLQHPSVGGNLRKVESEADVLAILEAAW